MNIRSYEPLSIDLILDWAVKVLRPSRTASLDARVLLEHVMGLSRSSVMAHGGEAVDNRKADIYRELVRRRAEGEPVAYLRRWVEWYGAQYIMGPNVLIPRPETEVVLEFAAELFRSMHGVRAVDVGTGSGVIAIQLALSSPQAHIDAVDISCDALQIARQNAVRSGVASRVSLWQGNLLEPLSKKPDLIVANLPYLSVELMGDLPRDVKFEPRIALHGGQDGLDVYREMLGQLRDRGWVVPVVAEIDSQQAENAARLFTDALPSLQVEVRPDYSGRSRAVIARPGMVSC